jgi:HK97 gp10 family phage protein
MKTTLTTKGFDEYLEKIAQAGKDIDAISDDALKAGGEVLVEGMRRRARERTGNLKRKIRATQPKQDGNFHYTEVGLPAGTDADTARYGNANEFGTANMAAQPYIRPALDEDMKTARAAMRKVFEESGAV